jgi:hypothetical protein
MSSDRWYLRAPIQLLFWIAIIGVIVQLALVELWPFLLLFLACVLLAIPVLVLEWRGKM